MGAAGEEAPPILRPKKSVGFARGSRQPTNAESDEDCTIRNKDGVQRTNNELAGFHFHGSKFGNQWLRDVVLLVLPIQSVSKFHADDLFLNKGAYLFLSRRSSALLTKFAILTRCWLARRG